jgi:UDP-glucuronate 4-epimerase
MSDARSSSRTVLVTGAAGFIGSHTVEALLARGDRVIGLDNLDDFYEPAMKRRTVEAIESREDAQRFTFAEGDIRDADRVRGLLEEHRIRDVVHLAARAGVRPSIQQPALYADVNVRGTTVMLEASRVCGVERFIMASSSSVYGNNTKVPFAETDDVSEPISPYAATKRSCELIAHTFHHLYQMPIACLRFFTVFGPRQRPDLAIQKFMRLLEAGESIPMFGDGSTSRDFTYIDDIVAGVLASIDRIGEHGFRVWNLGGNRPVSLKDMIQTVADAAGVEAKIDRQPMQPGDVNRTYADLTRSGAELGYAPTTPFAEGVKKQWAWRREQSGAVQANR